MHRSALKTKVRVETIQIGKVKPFGPNNKFRSAIGKHAVSGPVYVSFVGLRGDAQADLKHHGGQEMAVHHYPVEHYDAWCLEFGGGFRNKLFGENISTRGLTEETICVGDIFQLGEAVLQISQARQPCWKLNYRTGYEALALRVQETLRTGWYYRVLREGHIAVGDLVTNLERPQSDWPLSRVLHHLYVDKLNSRANESLANLEELSQSWRRLFLNRLQNGKVEDWTHRITTP